MLRVFLLVFILPFGFGCSEDIKSTSSQSESLSTPSTIALTDIALTDDAGRTVTLQLPAKRIISLAPNLTEFLFEIGAGSTVVAVSNADDYPPDVDALPRYSSFPMDYEALVSFNPDVLLATDVINNPKDADQFTSLGLPILFYSFKTWEDIPRIMREISKITGNTIYANERAS